MKGVTLVADILSLTNEDIDSDFPCIDGACLRLIDWKKILEVKEWFRGVTDDPSPDVCFALTVEVLEELTPSCTTTLKTLKSIPSSTSGATVPGPTSCFCWPCWSWFGLWVFQGNKQSFSDLKQFQDAHRWIWWHCHLISKSRSQDIGNVFDFNFESTFDVEKKLFKLLNEFALSCLEHALHSLLM